MLVYRISKKEFIKDLTGFGAAMYGGRWNPKGISLVYTAGNIALAYVEFLVHNYHILSKTSICMACIEIDENPSIETVDINNLPDLWSRKQEYLTETQDIGKQFIKKGESYILQVPSAVVHGEFNFLLNPAHEYHVNTKVKEYVDPFEFDPRLVKALKL